ncbi:MAG TPA: DUF364 domain-containing protein [Syntrophomonadaceae bacterium]|nr:DUF364 domain-containing protein [Syntrophomonadaceae bacterium]
MASKKRNKNKNKKDDWEELYDEIIDSVSEKLSVLECMVGLHWTLIRSENGTGLARTLAGDEDTFELHNITGMPLKKLAGYMKSRNLLEASLGLAAINSALNHHDYIEEISDPDNSNAFNNLVSAFEGKKVAMVGHFPMLEPLGDICELTVIDREAHDNVYSEAMGENILPDQDFVFITGTTFIYKTAPRLIELSKNATVTLLGPSVPLSRILFNYGVNTLAGVVVTDESALWQAVREGGRQNALDNGTQTIFIYR